MAESNRRGVTGTSGNYRAGSGDSRGKAMSKGADLQGMSGESNQYRPFPKTPANAGVFLVLGSE
jgi:hypothetical protein